MANILHMPKPFNVRRTVRLFTLQSACVATSECIYGAAEVPAWGDQTAAAFVTNKPRRFAKLPHGWKGPQSPLECVKLNRAFGMVDRHSCRAIARRNARVEA